MARKRNTNVANVPQADLAYAVGRLITMGKTTAQQVRQLASERTDRISRLRAELAALEGGTVVVASAKATPKGKPVAVGKKVLRRNGRPFTRSAKVVAARKVQGQYLGYLRQVPKGAKRAAFQKIAHEKGVPAAVAALKKHLGK